MRAAGVEAFAFKSARDTRGGSNVALFEAVFAAKKPVGPETWLCSAQNDCIEFSNRFLNLNVTFPRTAFLVGGVLPQPDIAP